MSNNEFRKGDKVCWSSHGGEADGEVIKKVTSDTEAAGRTVRAFPADGRSPGPDGV
ncbi:DUF2945 domain-containing protein [Pseudonocardia parietis]|uniref:Hypervirulence associated protein TUDOR domain-containing protein n=1 Tax=Pseudonocardia parietis TaxID=570936 RepID=A0ABS4VUL5_9PSEU|nr:DUF2945 domain-containing protein [Pseudonocardia parietis]MBP2367609.1 hypothetical protein [Pseudonocardia parietis]